MIVRREGVEGQRDALRNSILARIRSGKWQNDAEKWARSTDPKDWVQESLDAATAFAYRFPNGTTVPMYHKNQPYPAVVLPDEYYLNYMAPAGIVEKQLAIAAVRLAHLLNTAFT